MQACTNRILKPSSSQCTDPISSSSQCTAHLQLHLVHSSSLQLHLVHSSSLQLQPVHSSSLQLQPVHSSSLVAALPGRVSLMSTHRLPLGPCLHALMGYVVIILTSLPDFSKGQNCSHPIIPEHGGFYCKPSPCRGFPPRSHIYYFCESGYILPNRIHHSNCRKGRWDPSIPKCIPNTAGHAKHEDRVASSVPSVATTAVGVSIFLLTTTACMVIKSRLYPCHSHGRRSSDQLDLMVDGLPVSLPTYEEAVYGSWGQRITPLRGPTQLLLASSENRPISSLIQSGSSNCTNTSNPSAEEPPPYDTPPCLVDGGREGEALASHIALSVGKDN